MLFLELTIEWTKATFNRSNDFMEWLILGAIPVTHNDNLVYIVFVLRTNLISTARQLLLKFMQSASKDFVAVHFLMECHNWSTQQSKMKCCSKISALQCILLLRYVATMDCHRLSTYSTRWRWVKKNNVHRLHANCFLFQTSHSVGINSFSCEY